MGIVSHDLRNPLSTMHVGAQLLARMGATPQQLDIIDRMLRAGDRANRLVGDLLDFIQSRAGAGLAVTPREVGDARALVCDAVEELALVFPDRELRHVHAGAGPVQVDPHRLVQLLGNLVGNAMVYGFAHTPVTVCSRIGADRFTLSVHNHGEPIEQEALPRLFEPLARGDAAAGASTSVGLGLHIVNEIAKAHGGWIGVTSTAAEGTTFELTIPTVPVMADQEPVRT
nr:HAMP domain-containing sensor histidine kinase [Ramlibacter aurantiacus]